MDQAIYMMCLFFRLLYKIVTVKNYLEEPLSVYRIKRLLIIGKFLISTLTLEKFIKRLERVEKYLDKRKNEKDGTTTAKSIMSEPTVISKWVQQEHIMHLSKSYKISESANINNGVKPIVKLVTAGMWNNAVSKNEDNSENNSEKNIESQPVINLSFYWRNHCRGRPAFLRCLRQKKAQ